MELSPRKQAVLAAVTSAYIKTGEPIGSKALTLLLKNAPSSATLRSEMSELCDALVNKTDLSADEKLSGHAEWMNGLYTKYGDVKPSQAEEIIKREIGAVFEQVLLDAGVYKRDEKGKEAFIRFVCALEK